MEVKGNINSWMKKKDISFFQLIIETCNAESKLATDPECKSDIEIDKWLKGKYLGKYFI